MVIHYLLALLSPTLAGAQILGPESFETAVPPAGWTQVDVAGNGFLWTRDDTRANTDTYAAFFDDVVGVADAWLISPSIDLSTATTPRLRYYENISFAASADIHQVLASSDYAGGDPTLATWTTLRSAIGAEDTWTSPGPLDLSVFVGQSSVHVAFRYAGAFASEWWIDDVEVREAAPFEVEVTPIDVISTLAPQIGATTPVRFRVTNNGTSADSYSLAAMGTFAGTVTPTQTGVLAPGASLEVEVAADVPCGATLGMAELLDLEATSETSGSINATASVDLSPADATAGESDGYFFANSLAPCATTRPTFAWIDISATGQNITASLGDDTLAGPFALGFPFPFFDSTHNELWVSSNGWISFDGTDPGSFANAANTAFPDPAAPNSVVAIFWDDLDPTEPGPGATRVLVGAGPAGEFVVTYERLPSQNAGAADWITTQLVLEPSGNLRVQNLEHGATFDLGRASVGLEDAVGARGLTYRINSDGGVLFSSPLAVAFGTDPSSLPVELLRVWVE